MRSVTRVRANRRRVDRARARIVPLAIAGMAVLIGGVLVAGCTAASNSASDAPAGETAIAATMAAPTGGALGSGGGDSSSGSATGDGSGSSGSSGSSDVPLVDDRQIIRTAMVALRITVAPGKDDQATTTALTAAASAAAVKVRALAPGTGGYVSASDGGGTTISVTLRVPTASYDSVMNGLAGIGEVTSRTEKTDDVTDQMVDVASRIATMKASVDRIRALLSKADKIGDVIAIESELTQREADLESLQNRQAALGNQVALSTISVTVTAATRTSDDVVVAEQEHHGFLAGLAGGWHALLTFGTWLGSVIGALLPFLPVIAVVAAVAIWIARRRRRAAVSVSAAPGNPEAGVVSK